MYDTVLVPTDGSQAMETVIEHAAEIATHRGASVHVLYVVDDRAFLTLDEDRIPDVTDSLRSEGERATDAIEETLTSDGIEVVTEIRQGSPAEEILAAADECGADLIVMGSHGDDPMRDLLGSVSQKVVTLSSTPVLTITISGNDERGSSSTVK